MSRKKAWDHVATRKHEILRVYTEKRDYTDIMLIGKLDAKYKNGNNLSSEFAARATFEVQGDGKVKANSYQVWVVSSPSPLSLLNGN